jgi:hypothetical protein
MDPETVKVLHDAFKRGSMSRQTSPRWPGSTRSVFYLSSEEYHAFAMQQIAQEKRMIEELKLKGGIRADQDPSLHSLPAG